MRLTGYMYKVEGLDEYDSEVEGAVITNSRISLDWDEDGDPMHAVLHSTDGGSYYKGMFGSLTPEVGCVMEGTRYVAKNGEALLWLKWHRKDNGSGGCSILHLAAAWEE